MSEEISTESGTEISPEIAENAAGPVEAVPAPQRASRIRRALAASLGGARLITRLGMPIIQGTFKRLPLPGLGRRSVLLTPPIPVVTHTISALNMEVTILGIDGKGPVYSVIARLKALDSAGRQHQASAQAVQSAFQVQFAAHGETVTDVTTQAIIPALDDVQAWFAYARVTKQRARRR